MKKCNACKKDLNDKEFGEREVNGKKYLRTQCRKCESKKRLKNKKSSELSRENAKKKYNEKIKKMRLENIQTSRWILQDSKYVDKKKGLSNNLDREFIDKLINNKCSYCGEKNIRMTLDRIDNNIGHIKDNVVCSCIRCNYTRGNMPYNAWLVVAKGMKKARALGLFGEWTGRVK